MTPKKILITGGNGMLAYDFIRTQSERFDIVAVERRECDITSFESIVQCIALHEPDVLINCAAYTAVDDAEDIGAKTNYDVNTLWVYNLAKATSAFGIEFITISTDYVFDGKNSDGYLPSDLPNPINAYGMAKYLGEKLALDMNPHTIIVRTSWLYGGEVYNGNPEKKWVYKNFVNTMLRLSETRDEVRVVDDQHGRPTSCIDLSEALAQIIEYWEEDSLGQIFHLSNSSDGVSPTWADFAREIFAIAWRGTQVSNCTSAEYPTKAKRPEWGILKNNSGIILDTWQHGLWRYLENERI